MIRTHSQLNGFNIRQAKESDAAEIASVHIASWQSTYSGIISSSYLLNLRVEDKTLFWREILHFEYNTIYVVEHYEHQIVGFISSDIKKTIGTIHAIYILKEFQRLKLGTRLFLQAIESLLSKGCQKLELSVLKQNEFRKFYEKLNGHVIKTRSIKIADEDHEELLLRWDDLHSLRIALLRNN